MPTSCIQTFLCIVALSYSAVPAAADTSDTSAATKLEEIVVTARKREERLQDVPVPVTVISADTLVDTNQLTLQDYYSSVPGLNWAPGDFHNAPMLAIRGITTGAGFLNPTVGVTVDDVPFGMTVGNTGGYLPDIDPTDLARIEVLRGPQGTLYGASSMGGLIKYVTVDPSTDGFSGRLQASTSAIKNGTEAGYGFTGALNAPLGSSFAARISGFARQDPGYVDNVVSGQSGVNESHAYGGHLSALWHVMDGVTLKLSALLQYNSLDGSPLVVPSLGDLRQNFLPGTGETSNHYEAYSALLNARLGDAAHLTVLTGYNASSFTDSYDFTAVFGPINQAAFGVPGSPLLDHSSAGKFSSEVRLDGTLWSRLDWRVGGFYTHEDNTYGNYILAADPASGQIVGTFQHIEGAHNIYEEYAGFTDLTYHFTDAFDVQIGGRETEIKQHDKGGGYAYFFPGPGFTGGAARRSPNENFFTYLFTPRLKLTPDLMVYGRLASGYTPGGGLTPRPTDACVVFNYPCTNGPDTTRNYEVGAKADLIDHSLSVDASVYYIDWKDIQLQLFAPNGDGFTTNAGSAKSQGVELSIESRPIGGLTLALWVAWDEAVLTKAIPSNSTAIGADGEQLPYSSRFSGNFSVNEEFLVGWGWKGFVGGTVSYVGTRQGQFATVFVPQRQTYPGYTKTDLRAGVKRDSWSIGLYVNNVADVRGLIGGGVQSFNPEAFNIIQPRAVGLTIAKQF